MREEIINEINFLSEKIKQEYLEKNNTSTYLGSCRKMMHVDYAAHFTVNQNLTDNLNKLLELRARYAKYLLKTENSNLDEVIKERAYQLIDTINLNIMRLLGI